MSLVNRIFGAASTGLAAAGALLMVLMMLHIVADVLSKWLLNYPIDGTLEIVSHYYMVGLIYLPLGYVQFHHRHIVAEIFTDGLPGRPRALLESAIALLMLAYAAVFVWTTSIEALRKTAELEYLEATRRFIVIWPTRWFVPIGIGLMGLVAAYQAVRFLRDATGAAPPRYDQHGL